MSTKKKENIKLNQSVSGERILFLINGAGLDICIYIYTQNYILTPTNTRYKNQSQMIWRSKCVTGKIIKLLGESKEWPWARQFS